MHYLKEELYDLLKSNSQIFDFLQIGSLDGMWYWDLEHPEHEWMSPEFWKLFGIDPETRRHTPDEWQDLIHPDDLATALDNFHKHLEDANHPYDQIVRYRHVDGHYVTVRCRGLAIRDESGKPIRMLGAHNDLTLLKQREEELNAKNALLEREVQRANSAVAAQTAFLGTMSHEIRTPLNVIIGLLGLIKDDENALHKTRERADVGYRAAENLLLQLVNVLEMTRIESNAMQVQLGNWSLADFQAQCASILHGSVHNHGKDIGTGVQVNGEAPEVLCVDQGKVMQIVTNLVDNAVKFTDDGRVDLSISFVSSPEPVMKVSVFDTGPGVSPADRARAFDRFTQLQHAQSLHRGGSGLGLAICKELAELMGGAFYFVDRPPENYSLGIELMLPLVD